MRTHANYADNDNETENDSENVNDNAYKNNKCPNFKNSDESKLIEFFFESYHCIKGRPHPYIKAEQLNSIQKELAYFMGDHCLEVEDMEEMISLFFTEPPHNSDGNINLFADRRVMTVLGYKTGAITGYTD